MARLIPNETTEIYFVPTIAAEDLNPTVAEITGGTRLTCHVITLEASTTGNTVATPDFCSLFETSIPGTVTATFTLEAYRDDEDDEAWDTLPRGTTGFIVIAHYGFSGVDGDPASGDVVEVWPVTVTARSNMALTSNEAIRFGVEATVPQVPNEDGAVAA